MRAVSPGPSRDTDIANRADGRFRLRFLLLLSGAFLAVQVLVTDYGDGHSGAAGFWFVVGCLLLWITYRWRSRTARGVVIVSSLVGAVLYGTATLEDPHAAVVALAHLGQAVPLMLGPVRQHVRTAA